jgi:homoserine acetyltransferase
MRSGRSIFPHCNYDGMVQGLYRLLTEGLHVRHLRLVLRYSMGGFINQWDGSRDYSPFPQLARIEAPVLAINLADDERNPPETGLMTQALTHVKNAHLLLIPDSAETSGHGTGVMAKYWQQQRRDFLAAMPRRTM